jgi:hypothetical protein
MSIIENLETLRSAVAVQPEKKFSLSSYKRYAECGTLFCTAGLAATMPYFQELGLSFRGFGSGSDENKTWIVQVKDQDIDWSDETDQIFGYRAFNELFSVAGFGGCDHKVGYRFIKANGEETDDSYAGKPNMTDKELALARLGYRIEQLKAAE